MHLERKTYLCSVAIVLASCGGRAAPQGSTDSDAGIGSGDDASIPFPDGALPTDAAPPSGKPVSLALLSGDHGCAIVDDGTLACWGSNAFRELGYDGSAQLDDAGPLNGPYSPAPRIVQSVGAVTNAAMGDAATCAILSDGTVRCWGNDREGELGDGRTGVDVSLPVTVTGLSNAKSLALGIENACAIRSGGDVVCWGYNSNGQVGDGSRDTLRPVPVAAVGVANATELALGDRFSCARLADGTVSCWGDDTHGQIGDGIADATKPTLIPKPVAGLTGVAHIVAGYHFVCVQLLDRSIACWGDNYAGELGRGATGGDGLVPAPVKGLGGGVVQIAAGGDSMCALLDDTTVWCWGENDHGQLGNGGSANTGVPFRVPDLSGLTQIACGNDHACALTSTQEILCWGRNDMGQLGIGFAGGDHRPARVSW